MLLLKITDISACTHSGSFNIVASVHFDCLNGGAFNYYNSNIKWVNYRLRITIVTSTASWKCKPIMEGRIILLLFSVFYWKTKFWHMLNHLLTVVARYVALVLHWCINIIWVYAKFEFEYGNRKVVYSLYLTSCLSVIFSHSVVICPTGLNKQLIQ